MDDENLPAALYDPSTRDEAWMQFLRRYSATIKSQVRIAPEAPPEDQKTSTTRFCSAS